MIPLRRTAGLVLAAAVSVTMVACSSSPSTVPDRGSAPTPGSAGSATAATTENAALRQVRVEVPAGLRAAPFDVARTVRLPAGWRMSVWARVDGARLAVWTPDRRLLVSRPGHGDVVVLTPRGDRTPSQATLVRGLRKPHGMAFAGSTLYVAESDRIDAYRYRDGRASDRRLVVSGLPDASLPGLGGRYAHALKSVVVGHDGSLYFSIGSSGNLVPADRTARPERATIMRWSPKTRKLTVFARGVRNGTGLALDPDGALWTAVNNRDQMPYPLHRDWDGDGRDDYGKVIQSYVNDHPLEPVAKLTAGRDLGWPFCDPDPSQPTDVPGAVLRYADRPFVDDPQTNPDGRRLDCARLPRIEQGLPAHSAPLQMIFTTLPQPYGTGALIAAHGSWNRTPPRPSQVWFLPWSKGRLGNAIPLITGFQLPDGSRWGRLVGLAVGPDRALYVTDDSAGAVYRVTLG
ncbi:glucose/arabinose dehydrogenase [Friedmanniella endophytica]|uniref:Glucose/arabinose dehydrogenase n=1 Tax=Microlunatus kandeliicorticis TaxID=1759536 RepID=A0A7W3IPT5_9ACTN|nr:hypothetical protein [Microlunatus kandeliicorticis]MBA8792950.1 glucose/arabinose dehydrogenase [Microlunatus kandeliicorticis]